jgi:aryl-alcohol dehydrogenase (NADP+)
MQNHYNLLYREEDREMLPLCKAEGLAVLPWSPLARGLLTGGREKVDSKATSRAASDDYTRALYDDALDMPVVDRLRDVASVRGVPMAQVALAWLWHRPEVTAPIIGATRLQHLDDAVAAAELELGDEERRRLEEPYQPHRVLGHR